MGQTSISMLNKVGYSMYWNSMWDNKLNYNIVLKEDIYLRSFFKYVLNDNASFKYNSSLKKSNIYLKFKKSSINKNLLNFNNKINFYSAKLWIFRFQKWIILYNFIYIPNFNQLSSEQRKFKIYNRNMNSSDVFKLYKKTSLKIKTSYNILTKNFLQF